MRNYLPIAWLILVPVSAVVSFVGWIPRLGKLETFNILTIVAGIAVSSLQYGAIAALYAILNRLATRNLIFTLGAAQLTCSFLSLLFANYLRFLLQKSFAAGDRIDLQATVTWSTAAAVVSALATLAFFAAMIVALQDIRKRIKLQTFD